MRADVRGESRETFGAAMVLHYHAQSRFTERTATHLQIPRIEVGVPGDGTAAIRTTLCEVFEDGISFESQIARVAPPQRSAERLQTPPPGGRGPTPSFARQAAAPWREPALQAAPVSRERLQEMQPGDEHTPLDSAQPRHALRPVRKPPRSAACAHTAQYAVM